MNRTAAALILLAVASAAPAYGQREAFRRNPPPAEPLYELRLPEIQSTVLTNGLELSVLTPGGPGRDDEPPAPHLRRRGLLSPRPAGTGVRRGSDVRPGNPAPLLLRCGRPSGRRRRQPLRPGPSGLRPVLLPLPVRIPRPRPGASQPAHPPAQPDGERVERHQAHPDPGLHRTGPRSRVRRPAPSRPGPLPGPSLQERVLFAGPRPELDPPRRERVRGRPVSAQQRPPRDRREPEPEHGGAQGLPPSRGLAGQGPPPLALPRRPAARARAHLPDRRAPSPGLHDHDGDRLFPARRRRPARPDRPRPGPGRDAGLPAVHEPPRIEELRLFRLVRDPVPPRDGPR